MGGVWAFRRGVVSDSGWWNGRASPVPTLLFRVGSRGIVTDLAPLRGNRGANS